MTSPWSLLEIRGGPRAGPRCHCGVQCWLTRPVRTLGEGSQRRSEVVMGKEPLVARSSVPVTLSLGVGAGTGLLS